VFFFCDFFREQLFSCSLDYMHTYKYKHLCTHVNIHIHLVHMYVHINTPRIHVWKYIHLPWINAFSHTSTVSDDAGEHTLTTGAMFIGFGLWISKRNAERTKLYDLRVSIFICARSRLKCLTDLFAPWCVMCLLLCLHFLWPYSQIVENSY